MKRHIVAGVTLLAAYLNALMTNPGLFRPPFCLRCGKAGLWGHGHYDRKSDYENFGKHSLNPIPILRFYCKHCHRTCSTLPECIPPHRHYPWLIQQSVMLLFISGLNYRKISQEVKPSRWTISRWFHRWQSKFSVHASHLRSLLPELGKTTEFNSFWKSVIDKFDLSGVMLRLNNAESIIP